MPCPHCESAATTECPHRTELGYRRFRCRTCQRRVNERTGTAYNRLRYPTDIVSLVVLWRVRDKLSLRDLAEMFLQRGVVFTHETVRNWEAQLAPVLTELWRRRRRGAVSASWYVDETDVRVQGQWPYLYRAIDRDGNLVDARRSETPDRITTDGPDAYPRAGRHVFGDQVAHRANRYFNNGLKQDHRGIKQRYRPRGDLNTLPRQHVSASSLMKAGPSSVRTRTATNPSHSRSDEPFIRRGSPNCWSCWQRHNPGPSDPRCPPHPHGVKVDTTPHTSIIRKFAVRHIPLL
jgi:transposase-like protein